MGLSGRVAGTSSQSLPVWVSILATMPFSFTLMMVFADRVCGVFRGVDHPDVIGGLVGDLIGDPAQLGIRIFVEIEHAPLVATKKAKRGGENKWELGFQRFFS